MNFSLNTIIIKPENNEQIKNAIILLHGYGGDGRDISMLTLNWKRFLKNTVFLCPDAPEICSINPQGYQWFDLTSEKDEIILEKSLVAEEKLNKFLDQVLDNFHLEPTSLALVGFIQGCIITIHPSIKKKKQINCLIGYSGKVINKKHLSDNINSKPKIFLMHGENDTIVPPTHLLEAKEYLNKHGISTKTKIFKDCEHRISVEGSSLGLGFLKKNLL